MITSGAASAIGPELQLGDVVVANTAVFDLMRSFKTVPFNGEEFSSGYKPSSETYLKTVNATPVAKNAVQLASQRKKTPTIYTFAVKNSLKEKMVIVTTDEFAYDDKTDHFKLEGKGAMVEMDDGVLGLAVSELRTKMPWLAIRNASDPQMPRFSSIDSSDTYKK